MVTIASSWEQIEVLRTHWLDLSTYPNSDPDFFRLICEMRSEVMRPFLAHIHVVGDSGCVLVGRVERQSAEIRFGYFRLFSIPVTFLTVVYGGVLGSEDEAVNGELVRTLLASCSKERVNAVKLSHIHTGGGLHRGILREAGIFRRNHFGSFQTHWKLELPGTFEEFLPRLSSSHRQQIRRKMRNIEKKFPDKVEVRCYSDVASLETICRDVEAIARLTYQRGLNAGFIDNVETRRRIELEARQGWLRMFVMYIDDVPVAYWWGQSYRGWFHSSALGYDPKWSEHSPGTYLMMKTYEHLCAQRHKGVDFGLGDARYKSQFGTSSYQEQTVYLYPASVKGVALNMLMSSCDAADRAARAVASRLGIVEKVKSFWRTKLRKTKSEETSPADTPAS